MAFHPKNIKKNWTSLQQDPYASIKMQARVTQYLVYFIMIIIAVVFIRIIWSSLHGASAYSLLISGITFVIMIYLLWTIYARTILPQKKILSHYENNPTPLSHKYIDVKNEVDEILNNFDKNGNRKK